MIEIELKKDYKDAISGNKNPVISIIDTETKQVLCTFTVEEDSDNKNQQPFKLNVSYIVENRVQISD